MEIAIACRTCLEYKNVKLVNISNKCHFNNSVKDVIIMLVPQMAATLHDIDVICENCFNILRICMSFIERCVVVEEQIKKQKELLKFVCINNVPILPAENSTPMVYDNSSFHIEGSPPSQENFVVNENTQINNVITDHNYSTNSTSTETINLNDFSVIPANFKENNRIISLDHLNDVITQRFVTDLAQSRVNILQASTNLTTKKRILLVGSHIFNAAYKCPNCPKRLDSQKRFNNHTLNCKKKPKSKEVVVEKILNCPNCNRVLKSSRMESHLKKHEEKKQAKEAELAARRREKRTLRCRICLERFTSKEEYEFHLEVHPPYVCEQCGKGFAQNTSLQAHKNTHNDPNSYICEICGRGFKDKGTLRYHKNLHENKRFKCDKCPKVFRVKSRLKRHTNIVHNPNYTDQCTKCGKLFKSKGSYNSHYRLVHLNLKPYKCEICEKQFGRADYLQHHKARHSNEPNKNVRFYRRREKLTISTDKPLPCKFCGKQFLNVYNLKNHIETHIKVRRYPCKFCPLTFARPQICKKHELIHKNLGNFFRCNICWKRVLTKEELDEHIETKHNNPKYACNVCGKLFHREYLLNHHKTLEHMTPEDTQRAQEIVYESLLEVTNEITPET